MKAIRSIVVGGLWVAGLGGVAEVNAQGRVVPAPDRLTERVGAVPGPRYEAGRLHRLLLGSGWRDLWIDSLKLPVLRIDIFEGGLTPLREGGNAQSVTLHLTDAHGGRWIFRSVDKYPGERLADGIEGTLAGYLIQDQISSLHPAGALVIPPLLDALGILHVHPVQHVMPDDSRLGEFRERFAGMIGMIEEKPAAGVAGVPGFAGATWILDTEELLDRLEEEPLQRVAQHELLRARLVDFIIGDTDRTPDNYDWAGFPDDERAGGMIWRPIPRDRDWAFIRADGLVASLVARTAMPKLTRFNREHSSLAAHTASSGTSLDRRLLTGLDRDAFQREIMFVKTTLSDSLIEAAVHALPRSYPAAHRQWIAAAMKARRDALSSIGREFYTWLARAVDIHASDDVEHLEVLRRDDGTTKVSISAASGAVISEGDGGASTRPFYDRVFRRTETEEIRIFLHGGDDVAVVRGSGRGSTVRLIGGGGDDVLVDSSSAPGVYFYDGRGDDCVIRGPHTVTVSDRGGHDDWRVDFGDEVGVGVAIDHAETVGLVFGAGPVLTEYGFRHAPYRWRAKVFGLTDAELSPGARMQVEYRFEGSRSSAELDVRWSSFDAFRWFGAGNRSVHVPDDVSLVRSPRVSARSSFVWRFGEQHAQDGRPKSFLESDPVEVPFHGSLAAGPIVRHTTTDALPGSPFAADDGLESVLWQVGIAANAELERVDRLPDPRRGFRMRASVEGISGMLNEGGRTGSVSAEVGGYVPLIGDGPHLALRAGGHRVFGDYTPFDAATVGGRRSLRGFASGRFAGDVGVFAGTELRVPVADLPWIAPGQVGVFGLVDAGRVWVDGESPGGWHTSRGAGVWVRAFRRAASIAYVSGEEPSLYVWLGLPY